MANLASRPDLAAVPGGHEPWLRSYRSPMPIRCRGPLHFYSARHVASDWLHVVVTAPGPPSPAANDARARLANLARVHRLVAGEHVPGVAAEGLAAPTPWVALDCDAVADQEHVTEAIRQSGDRPHYEQASSMGMRLMETLARTHRMRDPETSRPICLGSLAPSNILFSTTGEMWLVGFGAGPLSGASIAPEVASGGPPSPGADVFALTLFLRSQLEFVRMPPIARRVFAGTSLARDAKVLLIFVWSNLEILAAPARRRPNMDATLAQARAMWRLLGFEPDVAGLAEWLAGVLAVAPERLATARAPSPLDAPRIVVAREAEWVETPNGMRHGLRARRPLRRFLLALAEARRDRCGSAVTVDELLHAGWPGENPLPEAGSNRVYVAVSTLRKLGLGDSLQRWDDGYRLDPTVPCEFV